jgi:hypothetical protein
MNFKRQACGRKNAADRRAGERRHYPQGLPPGNPLSDMGQGRSNGQSTNMIPIMLTRKISVRTPRTPAQ